MIYLRTNQRRTLHLWLLCLLMPFGSAYTQAQKYAPDTLKTCIIDLAQELDAKHPGFYRYRSKAEWNRYADSLKLSLTDSLSDLEFYRLLKPFFSSIGCLHTGISLPQAYRDSLDRLPNLLPLQLYVTGNRAYIVQNFSTDSSLRPGAEVLRINGKPTEALLAVLLPAIPADGYNQTLKYRALYHSFPQWYRNMVEVTSVFNIETRQQGQTLQHTVPGKTLAGLPFLQEPEYAEPLVFRIEDGVGRLTVHSFADSDIRRAKQRFKPFVDNTFRQLREAEVQHLLLDLRDNTGGSDGNAAYLARYFFDAPYRYWDRIEVTESVAREIKGLYRIFYRKPVQRDSLWLWQKAKTVPDFDYYELQKPVAQPYRGQVYVLINGFCMSSCSDFAAVLSQRENVHFFGEETGGGCQGNNSGMMPSSVLKPTRLTVTVPLQSYYISALSGQSFGRGTVPQYPVETSTEDLIRNEDKTLNFVRTFIQKRKQTF